jgi:hypothetical protein
MDLGTLEKRLAEKGLSRRPSLAPDGSNPTSPSLNDGTTPTKDGSHSSPRSALTSPEPQPSHASEKNGDKRGESKEPEKTPEEVEALSDMMCSLVTNNCGETRYIGKLEYVLLLGR